jgi:hypothetical protein
MNFGAPAGSGLAQFALDRNCQFGSPVTTRLIATEVNAQQVDVELQTRGDLTASLSQPPSYQRVRAAKLRVSYGGSGTVELFATDRGRPRKVQIVLRPELLRDRPDQP